MTAIRAAVPWVTQRWFDQGLTLTYGRRTVLSRIDLDDPVPGNLFDSFIENALDNARAKARKEPGIGIHIEFVQDASRSTLTVSDTGSAVPPVVALRLFSEPVDRGEGLGIGLYNVARQALAAGYRVSLADNRDGRVAFTLARAGADSGRG